MIFQRRAKRIAWACAAVLAVCLLALTLLESSAFFGAQKLHTSNLEGTYFPGNSDFGIVLCADQPSNRAALLQISRALGASVLLPASGGMPPDADKLMCLSDALGTRAELESGRVLVIAADEWASAALDFASTHPSTLGIALVRPALEPAPDPRGNDFAELMILDHAGEPNSEALRAVSLYNRLSGDTISDNGRPLHAVRGGISLALTSAPILSDAVLSDALLEELAGWIGERAGVSPVKSITQSAKTPLWLMGTAALLLGLFLLSLLCRNAYEGASGVVAAEVNRRWLFFLGRAALWFAALPLFGGIYLLFHLTNAPLGVGGRLFVSYLLSCSLTTGLLYRTGMLGVTGSPSDIRPVWSVRGVLRGLGLLTAVLLTGVVFAATGFWRTEITGDRLLLFGCLFAALSVGMLALMKDALMLSTAAHREETIAALLLIPYLPLLIPAALALPMGLLPVSFSLLRMLAALIASILCAKCIRELSGSALLAALCGALPFALFAAFQLEL